MSAAAGAGGDASGDVKSDAAAHAAASPVAPSSGDSHGSQASGGEEKQPVQAQAPAQEQAQRPSPEAAADGAAKEEHGRIVWEDLPAPADGNDAGRAGGPRATPGKLGSDATETGDEAAHACCNFYYMDRVGAVCCAPVRSVYNRVKRAVRKAHDSVERRHPILFSLAGIVALGGSLAMSWFTWRELRDSCLGDYVPVEVLAGVVAVAGLAGAAVLALSVLSFALGVTEWHYYAAPTWATSGPSAYELEAVMVARLRFRALWLGMLCFVLHDWPTFWAAAYYVNRVGFHERYYVEILQVLVSALRLFYPLRRLLGNSLFLFEPSRERQEVRARRQAIIHSLMRTRAWEVSVFFGLSDDIEQAAREKELLSERSSSRASLRSPSSDSLLPKSAVALGSLPPPASDAVSASAVGASDTRSESSEAHPAGGGVAPSPSGGVAPADAPPVDAASGSGVGGSAARSGSGARRKGERDAENSPLRRHGGLYSWLFFTRLRLPWSTASLLSEAARRGLLFVALGLAVVVLAVPFLFILFSLGRLATSNSPLVAGRAHVSLIECAGLSDQYCTRPGLNHSAPNPARGVDPELTACATLRALNSSAASATMWYKGRVPFEPVPSLSSDAATATARDVFVASVQSPVDFVVSGLGVGRRQWPKSEHELVWTRVTVDVANSIFSQNLNALNGTLRVLNRARSDGGVVNARRVTLPLFRFAGCIRSTNDLPTVVNVSDFSSSLFNQTTFFVATRWEGAPCARPPAAERDLAVWEHVLSVALPLLFYASLFFLVVDEYHIVQPAVHATLVMAAYAGVFFSAMIVSSDFFVAVQEGITERNELLRIGGVALLYIALVVVIVRGSKEVFLYWHFHALVTGNRAHAALARWAPTALPLVVSLLLYLYGSLRERSVY